jgi:hypothetical protein
MLMTGFDPKLKRIQMLLKLILEKLWKIGLEKEKEIPFPLPPFLDFGLLA